MPDVGNPPNITWRVEAAEHIFGDDRPFAQCHASTLIELPNGEFLAAWFGGTKGKHPVQWPSGSCMGVFDFWNLFRHRLLRRS